MFFFFFSPNKITLFRIALYRNEILSNILYYFRTGNKINLNKNQYKSQEAALEYVFKM